MVPLKPQFDTHHQDLELKKGESAQFSVALTNPNLDLRGCLVFAEIRRNSPGYTQIAGFTGSVSTSGDTITINQYPKTLDKSQLLSQLPVRQGDFVTLEGSGIVGSKVIAVTDSQIVVSNAASRTINEGRLLVRSLSVASFTAIPINAVTIITAANTSVGGTSIALKSLGLDVPSNTTLNFATRTADGWQYLGSARLTASATSSSTPTNLTVSPLSVAIPANAIAWFGTAAFNSFYLAIDPADTQFLESGNYGYDVICRQANGYTIRLVQGSVELTDHWSDGV
jgi:hypothetical protein